MHFTSYFSVAGANVQRAQRDRPLITGYSVELLVKGEGEEEGCAIMVTRAGSDKEQDEGVIICDRKCPFSPTQMVPV